MDVKGRHFITQSLDIVLWQLLAFAEYLDPSVYLAALGVQCCCCGRYVWPWRRRHDGHHAVGRLDILGLAHVCHFDVLHLRIVSPRAEERTISVASLYLPRLCEGAVQAVSCRDAGDRFCAGG